METIYTELEINGDSMPVVINYFEAIGVEDAIIDSVDLIKYSEYLNWSNDDGTVKEYAEAKRALKDERLIDIEAQAKYFISNEEVDSYHNSSLGQLGEVFKPFIERC